MDVRLALSRLIPVPMRTKYRTADGRAWRARWWQWRGRVYRNWAEPA